MKPKGKSRPFWLVSLRKDVDLREARYRSYSDYRIPIRAHSFLH